MKRRKERKIIKSVSVPESLNAAIQNAQIKNVSKWLCGLIQTELGEDNGKRTRSQELACELNEIEEKIKVLEKIRDEKKLLISFHHGEVKIPNG